MSRPDIESIAARAEACWLLNPDQPHEAHDLCRYVGRLETKVARMEAALTDLLWHHPDPCEPNRRGFCDNHWKEKPCSVAQAKAELGRQVAAEVAD